MLSTAPTDASPRHTTPRTLHHFICCVFGLLVCLAAGTSAPAQNVQDTKHKPDQTRRADTRVDPATHAISIQLPLGMYPGRAGLNLPIVITYNSKLWRLDYDGMSDQHGGPHTHVRAVFGADSVAGWTSSLKAPTLEFDSPGYDLTPVNYGQEGGAQGFTGAIARIRVRLSDGSTHELRKDDEPHNAATTPPSFHFTGSYYAVDGARLRFDFSTPNSGTLYLPDGSRYIYPVPALGDAPLATQYVDRNGNQLTYNRTTKEWTDTLGRVVKDPLSLFPNASQTPSVGDVTYTLPGVGDSQQTYTFQWRTLDYTDPQTNESVLTVAGPLYYPGDHDCDGETQPTLSPHLFQSLSTTGTGLTKVCAEQPFNPVVLSKLVLPNGTVYRFTYNVYGELEQVYLPTGGYERYVYPASMLPPLIYLKQPYRQMNRGVLERRVSADGTAASASVWHYGVEYDGNTDGPYATTTTAPDGTVTRQYWHAHPNFYDGSPARVVPFGMEDARTGRAYEECVYAPAAQGGLMLRRKLTDWAVTGPTTTNGYSGATRDARVAKEVDIMLDTDGQALTSTTTYEYDADLNIKAINHYDFVPVARQTAQTAGINSFSAGTLLRTDETDYLTVNQAYRARNLTGLPIATRVKDGAGRIVAQTAIRYDETALMAYGFGTGWVEPGTTARGNVTTVSQWLNTTNTWLESHMEYDQCGNVVKRSDARGQVATVEYAGDYARAYPTRTISPVPDTHGQYGSAVALEAMTTYDPTTGQVMTATDANGQTTRFEYGATDALGQPNPLRRPTKELRPDGGETSYAYGDTLGHLYALTRVKQDASVTLDAYQSFDGLGRVVRAQAFAGGTNYTTVDTKYDSMGRAAQVSNPYLAALNQTPNPDTRLWTVSGFDALGRVVTMTTPDAAQVKTAYAGPRVLVTDQAGKQRLSQTNVLGRLTDVWEIKPAEPNQVDPNLVPVTFPNHAEVVTGYRTSYQYDVLGNLRQVSQGAQHRYFAYDSLSRLLRTQNPEQAANAHLTFTAAELTALGLTTNDNNSWALGYGYDASGNLTEKRDARNLTTTYTYDALNRNTTVRYSNDPAGTPGVDRYYDSAVNGKGRLWRSEAVSEQRNSAGQVVGSIGTRTTVAAYDAAGRPRVQQQAFFATDNSTPANAYNVTYTVQRSYDLAGHVKTQTYPSGHAVSYNYDITGRLNDRGPDNPAFTGNLGDGMPRTYAQSLSYDEAGRLREERYGTQTRLYHKRHYNVRGQLCDVRLSTVPWQVDDVNWNRGALVLYYGNAPWQQSSPTNNGNVTRMEHWVPADERNTSHTFTQQTYEYDALNRLSQVTEAAGANYAVGASTGQQSYTYDAWGNRLIDQHPARTWGIGIPKLAFSFNPDTPDNRLYAPGDLSLAEYQRRMRYDAAGNLTYDAYTGTGARRYDAEHRMVAATNNLSQLSTYTYNADGQRTRRRSSGQETWHIYGMDGELLAEYQARAAAFLPQTEYGYRNGQLLIRATNGDEARLRRFITNMYAGALGRLPNTTEASYWLNQLGSAPSAPALLTQVQALGQALFASAEYAQRNRSDAQFITDLYWTYVQRAPDASGFAAWLALLGPPQRMARATVRDYFDDSQELVAITNRLYGLEGSAEARIDHLLNHLYAGALGREPNAAELSAGRARLSEAAAQGYRQVVAEVSNIGREVFTSAECEERNRSDAEYVTDLYAGLWQRAADEAGLISWTETVAQEERGGVLGQFLTSGEYKALAAALSVDVAWVVSDHLGTPRMVADKTGSLIGIKRHDYLPFGEELGAGVGGRTQQQGYGIPDGVRQKFGGGHEHDTETSLDYFGARYYGATMGRFTSVDPENASASLVDPQSWNGYGYGRNNPLLYTDPDGQTYLIRRSDGSTELITDDQFNQIKNNPNNDTLGVVVKGGTIYNRNENGDLVSVATYERVAFDDLTDNANRFIFGLARFGPAMEKTILAFTAANLAPAVIATAPGAIGGGITTLGLTAETTLPAAGEFAVIGELPATGNFIMQNGARVLNIRPWTPALNNQWIQKIIASRLPVFVATAADKMYRDGVLTQFGKEVQQLLAAGYTFSNNGHWLVPPP